MKLGKKWMACLLAVIMTFSLTACGVSGDQIAVNKPQHKGSTAKKRIAGVLICAGFIASVIWKRIKAKKNGKSLEYITKYLKYAELLASTNLPIIFDGQHLGGLIGIKHDYLYKVVNSQKNLI